MEQSNIVLTKKKVRGRIESSNFTEDMFTTTAMKI